MAVGHEGALDRLAHAVEHLHLVARGRHAVRLGGGHRGRQAPHVVARQGRAEPLVVLHQEPGATLETGVGLPLLQVDRLGPAELPGVHDLVVPVRPLDQPDRHRRASALDPRIEVAQVALGLGQVRLGHDSDVGPVAELRLRQDLTKDAERQVLVGVLLHVDVDIRAERAGRTEDRPEPRGDAVERRLGVQRIEPGRQAGQLEREVRARDRAVLVAVDLGDLGLVGQGPGKPAEQVEAGLLVDVGLGLADHRLAQQVGRERQPAGGGAGGRSRAPRPASRRR